MSGAPATGPGRPRPALAEIAAGFAAALVSLPLILANGAIAFAPLGAAAVVAGAAAAILTSGVAGVVLGALASSRPLAGGNSSAISLSLAAMLASAVSLGALPGSAEGVGAAAVLVAAVTLLAGLLLALAAALRLARAATLVPYPVLSGFLNGTALLLALTQLGPALGQGIAEWPRWGEVRPLAPLIALAALLPMLLPRPPGPLGRAPPVLRGFALGWALDAALRLLGFGALLGPVIGAPPDLATHAATVRAAFDVREVLALVAALAGPLLLAALAVAALQAVETLGVAAVLRERGGPRASLDRDLGALAAANAATGLLGGMPATGSLSATRGCLDAGGQGRLSAITRGALLLATLAVLGPVVAMIPQAVLAGVVLGAAASIADAGTLRPVIEGRRRKRPLGRVSDPLVMLAVAAAALVWGLAPAVLLGLGLAALAFTASMMGPGVIRRAWRNPGGRSRTRRAPEAEARLLAQGARIEVAELQGPIFFGSADAVAAHAERALAPDGKRGGADWLVLDLSRAARVDMSGGRQLLRLVSRPPRRGARVLLAGLAEGNAARADLEALGLWRDLPPGTAFPSLAAALEAAEEELLRGAAREGTGPGAAESLGAAEALARLGLPPGAAAAVLARAEERRFAAGAAILRQGDAPDALHVLLEGAAEIAIRRAPGEDRLRVATIAPGAIFGEMAVLTGAPRSADVVARADCRCLALSGAALAALEAEEPAAAGALLRAIARQIDSNLRLANTTIMTLES